MGGPPLQEPKLLSWGVRAGLCRKTGDRAGGIPSNSLVRHQRDWGSWFLAPQGSASRWCLSALTQGFSSFSSPSPVANPPINQAFWRTALPQGQGPPPSSCSVLHCNGNLSPNRDQKMPGQDICHPVRNIPPLQCCRHHQAPHIRPLPVYASPRVGAEPAPSPPPRWAAGPPSIPASLRNLSLFSGLQSFLQVFTATLTRSPFCKEKEGWGLLYPTPPGRGVGRQGRERAGCSPGWCRSPHRPLRKSLLRGSCPT